jgi:hypothetical protein
MPNAHLMLGQVMHERLRPARNRFVYPVFCLQLRTDALDSLTQPWFGVDCWRPLSIRQRDYGPRNGESLDAWIRQLLRDHALPADGAIWLHTFPRVFGFAFNPVNFWFCHDQAGHFTAMLAEVNNTFGEHHRYLLVPADAPSADGFVEMHSPKVFHVSPFCPVKGQYRFRVRRQADRLFVGIDYDDGNGPLLRTAVGGHLLAFTPRRLAAALLRQPFLTVGVVARIHLQALRLLIKRVPFFRKPAPPQAPLTLSTADESRP